MKKRTALEYTCHCCGSSFWGWFLLIIGLWFLARELGWISLGLSIWPFVLIIFGVWLLVKRRNK